MAGTHRRVAAGIFTDRRPGRVFRPVRVLFSPACMVKPNVAPSRKKKWPLPNFPYAASASRLFSHAQIERLYITKLAGFR
jgi:hypothetical protein